MLLTGIVHSSKVLKTLDFDALSVIDEKYLSRETKETFIKRLDNALSDLKNKPVFYGAVELDHEVNYGSFPKNLQDYNMYYNGINLGASSNSSVHTLSYTQLAEQKLEEAKQNLQHSVDIISSIQDATDANSKEETSSADLRSASSNLYDAQNFIMQAKKSFDTFNNAVKSRYTCEQVGQANTIYKYLEKMKVDISDINNSLWNKMKEKSIVD